MQEIMNYYFHEKKKTGIHEILKTRMDGGRMATWQCVLGSKGS